jgi:hypothetical protein
VLLLKILPGSYEYKLINFEDGYDGTFSATLGIKILNEKQAQEWIDDFAKSSKCSFTVMRSRNCKGMYKIYNRFMKCHHNVQRGKLSQRKHCDCPAEFSLSVFAETPLTGMRRPREETRRTEVRITWAHNHPIQSADVLRHRLISAETKAKLIALFNNGHSPSSALHMIKLDLECEDDGIEKLADRSLCPDLQACFHIFYRNFTAQFGGPDEACEKMKSNVTEMNTKFGSNCVSAHLDDNGQWTTAICTPFMKVCHQ